jgi:hypothetical protein
MKKLMILGALIGFSSGLIFGLAQGSPWPDVLWRASVVCLASSYLFRWWGRVWLRSLQQAQNERNEITDLNQAPPAKV